MSKTVKRVMTVMMVGLVAMLGANAEAHYFMKKGKLFYCSVCSDATLTQVPADPDDPTSIRPSIAELIVKTQKVRIKCPDGTDVQVNEELTLSGETPSVDWQGWTPGSQTAQVKLLFVADQVLGFCFDLGEPVPPSTMQIRKMTATYNAYECTGPDSNPCSSKVLVFSIKYKNCQIPPNAQPGTEYVCNNSSVVEHPL